MVNSKSKSKTTTVIEADTCPICMETLEKTNYASTKCGHQFCLDCLIRHVGNKANCPICRAVVGNPPPVPGPRTPRAPPPPLTQAPEFTPEFMAYMVGGARPAALTAAQNQYYQVLWPNGRQHTGATTVAGVLGPQGLLSDSESESESESEPEFDFEPSPDPVVLALRRWMLEPAAPTDLAAMHRHRMPPAQQQARDLQVQLDAAEQQQLRATAQAAAVAAAQAVGIAPAAPAPAPVVSSNRQRAWPQPAWAGST
jgi:hypothetical protein